MKVAVFGAGVGGLTTAHELIERGIDVEVYDRLSIPGGKARSVVVDRPGQQGLPGEHGFRFFPGFYRHIIDTMARIPLPGGGHVVDNLVDATMGYFAHPEGPPLKAPSVGPRSIKDLIERFGDLAGFRTVLSDADLEFFVGKMWQVMTSCSDRRLAEYELVSWVDFIDAETRSNAYQEWFAGAMTRTLIAASGEKASARTVGDILVILTIDGMRWGSHADRLLNGPTNDVWMTPWMSDLVAKGVTFHFDHHLDALHLDETSGRLTGATVTGPDGGAVEVVADHYVCALPVEVTSRLITDPIADVAPSLAATRTLGPNVAWMSGIQIYLRADAPIVHGHVAFAGSPWGLTAISQNQFWSEHVDHYGDHSVKGVLSVDISDWTTKGYNGSTAHECSPQEICDEVLDQIRRCLPELPPGQLAKENIHSFFIDPDIVFFQDGRPRTNHEPLFINEIGTHDVRPQAHTEIPNLFLASDYVRTNTDLATMEGANEAARRAVNAILLRTGSAAPRCKIWSQHEPRSLALFRWLDRRRFLRGEPWKSEFPFPVRWASQLVHRIDRKATS